MTRPTLDEVLAYRAHVDLHMHDRIAQGLAPADMLELGLQHEQQHQELIHTDIKILLSMNPLQPAVLPLLQTSMPAAEATQWIACHGGVDHGQLLCRGQDRAFGVQPNHQLSDFSICLTSNSSFIDGLNFIGWPTNRALPDGYPCWEKPSLDGVVNGCVGTVPGFSLDGWHSEY